MYFISECRWEHCDIYSSSHRRSFLLPVTIMERIKGKLSTHLGIGKKSAVGAGSARIVEEGYDVCTLANKENCYDPDSIRQAFKPLAMFAKVFGLFPRYDLSFVPLKQSSSMNVSSRLISPFFYLYKIFALFQ